MEIVQMNVMLQRELKGTYPQKIEILVIINLYNACSYTTVRINIIWTNVNCSRSNFSQMKISNITIAFLDITTDNTGKYDTNNLKGKKNRENSDIIAIQ